MSKDTSIDLHRALEALLFLAGKPLSIRKIAEFLGTDQRTTRSAVDAFRTTWNARGGGTVVALTGDEVQLVTHADLHAVAEQYVKDETRSELTRPQLEALTVIAYRGPITKAELEQIRGVHCGLILRNLLIRGLVEERRDAEKHEDVFTISMDFLRHLGLVDVRELPEYEHLHGSGIIQQYLSAAVAAPSEARSAKPQADGTTNAISL
ncbi:SMC-Scp complex subunit ScpB [Candidatus Uhrbacteria bacterium]|nr:SMC-Scp complex subunit ScpB [Candidatus Uhrbacteria bacterium]